MELNQEASDSDRDNLLHKATAGEQVTLTVRELLALWKLERRSPEAVEKIRSELHQRGLTTRPSFIDVWINSEVSLIATQGSGTQEVDPKELQEDQEHDLPNTASLQVKALPQANKQVECVELNDSIADALTKMTHFGYSQLGVLDAQGHLLGAISERSLAQASFRARPSTVGEAYDHVRHLRPETPLFDVEQELRDTGYGFVCSTDGKPCGIITTADLAAEFSSRLAPLITIESIELRVRQRVLARISHAELKQAHAIPNRSRDGDSPTLGAYAHLLKGRYWKMLEWQLPQEYFYKMMRKTARIRNHLAHFYPDPPSKSDLEDIARFEATLRNLT
ncbi:CBS domain-containing protein [Glycomyces sp. NPDC021274]|uniref:CBS domain-containing protein n=1 Tax=Glycomyces sp. NPDC021274 TaxID=3155120 RepID=UPI0033D10A49